MPTEGFELTFAADHDVPVCYIDRSREYYLAMGFSKPYVWTHLAEVPFAPLGKPLSQASVTVVTTAAPIEPGKGDQGPGAPMNRAPAFQKIYSAPTDDPPALGISHVHYDRDNTSGEDQRAFMPLPALVDAATTGRVGAVAPRFHGVPTRYSHRVTTKKDGPELLERLREDNTDVAILAAI